MKRIYLWYTILFTMLYSCKGINKEQIEYRNNLALFPKFTVDFFPNSITRPHITSINVDTTNRCIYFILYSFNDNTIQQIKKNAERQCIGKYSSNDSLLITVKRDAVFKWNKKYKVYYRNIKRQDKIYYPIVYFEPIDIIEAIGLNKKYVYSSFTQSGLSNNYTIYVYESRPGKYWNGLTELDYMPTRWKNGYSKGICVDEVDKVIIHWTVIW